MNRFLSRRSASVMAIVGAVVAATTLQAASVPLQNATASASTEGGFLPGHAIDNNPNTGWLAEDVPSTFAVETVSDMGFASGTNLTFTMRHDITGGAGEVSIGKFRLSLTTDDRSTFADGLANGGDVTATWTQLTPISLSSSDAGNTFTLNGDNTVLVGGTNTPFTAVVYTVTAATALQNITGIRLEVFLDPTLPDAGGPGRYGNGSFILTEFQVDAVAGVPEPGTLSLLTGSLFGLYMAWRKRG